MGNATIWFYPSPEVGLVEIDFAEALSDLQVDPIREVEDARAYDGTLYRSVLSGREQVRIVLERFTDEALARKFESLQAHLERGGSISFCNDKAKAWAGFTETAMAGGTFIGTGGHAFASYSASAALAAGDTICIESTNPEGLREFVSVDAVATADTEITTQQTILYNYLLLPALVRFRDFWPVLQWPAAQMGRSIVTHDHRISYTLDMTLETNPGTIAALAQNAENLGPDGVETGMGRIDLEDAAGMAGGVDFTPDAGGHQSGTFD